MYPEIQLEAEPFEIAPGLGEAGTGLEFPGGQYGGEMFYEAPAATCLSGKALTDAVAANRAIARQLGWCCIVGGILRPITWVQSRLGLPDGASENDIAQAICTYQQRDMGLPHGDGKMSFPIMQRMITHALSADTTYKPLVSPVTFGGQPLGVIEKTMAYIKDLIPTHAPTRATMTLQFGFRVSNIANVRRAGFVDANGDDNFRWVQVIEIRRTGIPGIDTSLSPLLRLGRGWIVDPTSALPHPGTDPHPYYWHENASAGSHPGHAVCNYRNRPANNGRFYNWIFFDRPNMPLVAARPGSRAFFNFETALVGVRPGNRNFLLNTIVWGFDILVKPTGGYEIRENNLANGPRGGSAKMRSLLNTLTNRGEFPGHCFAGPGFTGNAKCP